MDADMNIQASTASASTKWDNTGTKGFPGFVDLGVRSPDCKDKQTDEPVNTKCHDIQPLFQVIQMMNNDGEGYYPPSFISDIEELISRKDESLISLVHDYCYVATERQEEELSETDTDANSIQPVDVITDIQQPVSHMDHHCEVPINKLCELKKSVVMLQIARLEILWNSVFTNCSTSQGKVLSRNERNAKGLKDSNLIYGEITFRTQADIFYNKLNNILPNNSIFYDLGSGSGRAVFAAALLHDLYVCACVSVCVLLFVSLIISLSLSLSCLQPSSKKCVGVEILEGLCEASNQVLYDYKKTFLPNLDIIRQNQEIYFVQADLKDFDWSDGDFVYANSTCFSEDLMEFLSKASENMKVGSYFVSLTKELTSPCFKILSRETMRMSWGFATVIIHQKVL